MSQPPTEPASGFRADVAYLYGRLVGDADSHPHSGLLAAIHDLSVWVDEHPPPDQPEDSE